MADSVNTRMLPPGQQQVRGFPRFGTHLDRPAPDVPDDFQVRVSGAVTTPLSVPLATLAQLPRREVAADFHCVAGWSARNLHWEGVAYATFHRALVEPRLVPGASITHVLLGGLDRYRAAVRIEDAMADNVLLADRLDGRPLDSDHGAPLRFMSPNQYGYVNLKSLCRIELHSSEPKGLHDARPVMQLLSPHPRARVWHEERHRHIPAWALRRIYRATIPRVMALSEQGSEPGSTTE